MDNILERKHAVQGKLRSGSLVIASVCAAAALFNLGAAVMQGLNYVKYAHDPLSRFGLTRSCLQSVIAAVIMLLAALLFRGISKNGEPFSNRNIRTVSIIGVLVIANSIMPVFAADALSGTEMFVRGAAFDPNSLAVGLLFLCTGHIIRYGAMLQQESDETL